LWPRDLLLGRLPLAWGLLFLPLFPLENSSYHHKKPILVN
jgi:hypothetical protein